MSITEISIKRPSLILVIFIVLMGAGLFSLNKLSMELIPKFDAPFVIINTVYPGASPAEVENSVTRVIEDAVSNMEGIVSMRSTSFESVSFVFVEMKDGTDVDKAIADAQRRINAVAARLPDDAEPPALTKFASDEFPILSVGVSADLSETELYDVVKDRLKPAISSIEGVGNINIIGGQEREIKVLLNRAALESKGINMLQVVQALQTANLDFPTGKLENENEQITIRLSGKFQSVDDIRNQVVAVDKNTGAKVKLYEIAEVSDSKKDLVNLSRVDGKTALGLQISKTTDANAVAVADEVLALLDKLEQQYSDKKMEFSVANNQTTFTKDAVDAVEHDLLLAIVLVAVVMLFFLHSFRNALIVMLAIPTSLVSTLLMMYAFDFTLNLMTLLAMSLVIGILVDDSIVVLENIYRHLEMGERPRKAALIGRNEIGFTALSITLVDVVVFVPIALTSGIVGNIMRQFALVVTFSTLMSLFVSFTLTPMLASRFSKVEKFEGRTLGGIIFGGFERMLKRITNWYGRVVSRLLNPVKVPYPAFLRKRNAPAEAKQHFNVYLLATGMLMLVFYLFVSSFSLVSNGYIGTAFINPGDRGEFIMRLELPKDATLKESNLVALKAEEYLSKKKEITGIFTTVGLRTGMLNAQSMPYVTEMTLKLVPQDQRDGVVTDLYAQRTKNELEMLLPGVKVSAAPVSYFGGADQSPILIYISGDDHEEVMQYATKVLDKVKAIPGTVETELSIEEGNPQISVKVNRELMAQYGLSMAAVGATMQTAFNGNTDVKYRDGSKEYDVNIRLDEFNRNDVEDIANLVFVNPEGRQIRLRQFADVVQTTGPNQLERHNRLPSVTIRSNALGRPTGDIGVDIKRLFSEELPPPAGINIIYDGDLKNQEEGFGSLGLAFLASILLVYLIMVALYDSWVYPFVVMFSIPVAIMGALLAMALSLSVLDIFSIMGMIMMVGLVAKNAILLVDFANKAKEEGWNTHDALVEAGKVRLRPILMTTLSMVIGFLPIALAKGAGAEWKNGLAWALIGGLSSSMILTLMVVPVMYLFMDGLKDRFNNFMKRLGIFSDTGEDDDDWNNGSDKKGKILPEPELAGV
ncbi:MAG: acriflavin resistance protein [Saprospirales bacterium]|nr:acriflavin resistance protein [Saprospirales bacterium]